MLPVLLSSIRSATSRTMQLSTAWRQARPYTFLSSLSSTHLRSDTVLWSSLDNQANMSPSSMLPSTGPLWTGGLYPPHDLPTLIWDSDGTVQQPIVGDIIDYENEDGEGYMAIKRTYQPSLLRRKRKHGFLRRRRTVGGRKVIANRLRKGRKRLSP